MAHVRYLICGVCLLCLTGTVLLAGDDGRRAREYAMFVAEGTFRGYSLPGVASQQHGRALENWKKLYDKEPPVHFESDRFLIYATLEEKKLKEIGGLLDKTYAATTKTLELEGEAPWTGKLTVFLAGERSEFTTLVRALEKRRAEEDEQGSFDIDSEFPHVIAGPPVSKVDLAPEQEAGGQIAAALLVRKAGKAVPHWVQMGFGRASVLRAGPTTHLFAEHRRVAAALKGKRGLKDVLGRSALDPEETILLRASLMEYFAYSGRTAKFMPFLKGFQPSEEVPEPKIEHALNSANLVPEKLDAVWQTWVKGGFK